MSFFLNTKRKAEKGKVRQTDKRVDRVDSNNKKREKVVDGTESPPHWVLNVCASA